MERPADASSAVDPDNYRVTINAHNGYNVYATNGVHYVLAKEGDTFENIGKKFRISARNLRKFNDLKDKKAQPMPHEVVYIERKNAGRATPTPTPAVRAKRPTPWGSRTPSAPARARSSTSSGRATRSNRAARYA